MVVITVVGVACLEVLMSKQIQQRLRNLCDVRLIILHYLLKFVQEDMVQHENLSDIAKYNLMQLVIVNNLL